MVYKYARRFTDIYNLSNHFLESFRYAFLFKFYKIYCLRIKNYKIFLRNNEIDDQVLNSTFTKGYHLPPYKLNDNCTIIDLGSNIGLTVLDFHLKYPKAKIIIGIEMDESNYDISKKNLQGINNVILLNNAININNGITYYSGNDAQSYKITWDQDSAVNTAKSLTMQDLLLKYEIEIVDFLKIDIEGSEYDLICDKTSVVWLTKIKCFNIELHDHLVENNYKNKIIERLKSLGFIIYDHPTHFNAIIGINKLFL